jgi:hypothetical protein
MRSIENLLAPDSTELPDCNCGAELRLFAVKPNEDTEVRIFKCDDCLHEFQLMVWREPGTKIDALALKTA